MKSLFEDLMVQQGQSLTESFRKSRQKKTENLDCPKIKSSRIRVESLGIFESAEDAEVLDTEFNKDPLSDDEAEVVLVVDPDLSIEEEIPEDAAEQMVGDRIYKCPVCGSNYACGCDEEGNFTESVDLDENGEPTECPICNSDADQILVGEIVPLEDAETAEVEPGEFEPVDSGDDSSDDESDDPVIDQEGGTVEPIDDEEDKDKFENYHRSRRKSRRESVQVDISDDEVKVEVDDDEPTESILDVACDDEDCSLAEYEDDDEVYQFDDVKFESLMNQFLKENYKGNPRFKLEAVIHSGRSLKLEYVLTVGKKSRKGVFVAEGYDPKSRVLRMNAKDLGGQFTESTARKPAFKFECVNIGKKIIPTKITYDFKKKVNESVYRVYGTVDSKQKQVSESTSSRRHRVKESVDPPIVSEFKKTLKDILDSEGYREFVSEFINIDYDTFTEYVDWILDECEEVGRYFKEGSKIYSLSVDDLLEGEFVEEEEVGRLNDVLDKLRVRKDSVILSRDSDDADYQLYTYNNLVCLHINDGGYHHVFVTKKKQVSESTSSRRHRVKESQGYSDFIDIYYTGPSDNFSYLDIEDDDGEEKLEVLQKYLKVSNEDGFKVTSVDFSWHPDEDEYKEVYGAKGAKVVKFVQDAVDQGKLIYEAPYRDEESLYFYQEKVVGYDGVESYYIYEKSNSKK